MKRYYSHWLLALLCLFSCQPELELAPTSMILDDVPMAESIITGDGTLHLAGYGYDMAKEKPYPVAILPGQVIQDNSNIGNSGQPWEVSVKAVENRDSLRSFISQSSSFQIGIGSNPGGGDTPPTPDPGGGDNPPPPAPGGGDPPPPAPNPGGGDTPPASPNPGGGGDDGPPPMPVPNARMSAASSALEINGNSVTASLNRTKSLEDLMVFGENIINVVARIRVATDQYFVNDSPTLTPEAQQLLESDPDKFFDQYGTGLISANLLGGEVYFVYSFNTSASTIYSKRERLLEAQLALEGVFNIGGSSNNTSSELNTSYRRLVSSNVSSYVPGFVPAAAIMNEEEANAEAQRLLEYIKANPQNATSLDKQFLPYAAFAGGEGLLVEWERRLECYRRYEQWSVMEARLEEVIRDTNDENLRIEAKTASYDASMQVGLARNCGTSGDPARYQWILDAADGGAIGGGSGDNDTQTLPLYRYYSLERTNHYYSTDPESVKGIDGADSYQPEGIECRVFKEQGEGLTWLKEYWNNPYDDHRYESQLWMKGETQGYEYTRELGYIYENNTGLDESKIRQLYLYYNDEGKDHFMTTDPEGEFGSLAGGSGYRIMGTLGFVLASDE